MKSIYKILFSTIALFSYVAMAADKEPALYDFNDIHNKEITPGQKYPLNYGLPSGFYLDDYRFGTSVYSKVTIFGDRGVLPSNISGNFIGANELLLIERKDQQRFDLSGFNWQLYNGHSSAEITIRSYQNNKEVFNKTLTYGTGDDLANQFLLGITDVDKIYIFVNGGGMVTFFDNFAFNGASVSPINPVPEPSTYAMMIAGLGMVGMIAKRRRSSSRA